MEFKYLILSFFGLGLIAYLLAWLFFKFPDTSATSEYSQLDKDLLKIKKHADVHRSRSFIFALALFLVSFYVYYIVTYKTETEFVTVKKAKRVIHDDGNEIDDIILDIPEPEPPKPEVVLTPKVVDDNTVIEEVKKDELPLEDDLFNDDDLGDLKEEKKEDTAPKGPITTDQPSVMPQYVNGGEEGLSSKVTLLAESELSQFPPGFYVVPLQFVIEVNGAISGIKIAPGEEVEDPKMAEIIINAMKKAGKSGAFTPGSKDGQLVRVIMQMPIVLEML